jgi:choline dehydrogenase-like flavoprotein
MKLIPLLVSLVPLTSLTLASPTPNRSRRALTTSSASSLDASYDYIIVGGGLAGSVLARRLASSDKNIKILLIEAGSDQESNPNVYEAGKYQSTFDTPLDYAYPTVPQRSQGSKAIRAGKMLGGSTGINGLAWTKPHSFQIDALEQVGNQGVDWNLLNGYMKSAERFSPPGSAYLAEEDCHGTQGPIAVQYDPASSPLAFETRFNQTVVQSEGLRFAGDLTCGNPEGAGQVANTRDGDVRVTSCE